ncbi:MAG: sigma-70 family RNA polymerase sigma factor, partial [Clostridiales bacterium]|nr:sigma-70 family RNA polymerase sigma factor [Candidatus Equinaster intestinalis]
MDKEKIYFEYHEKVFGYILSKINNQHDAEDLTADLFVKIYAKLDTFDKNKASLSTWIYTVTRNTLTDYYRTRKVFGEIPEMLSDENSIEDEICNDEALDKLADALEALDKRERDIIILHY